jgi:thiamine pyrophosphate-dependent acetolactate synthase large subunit-like protein
MSLRRKKIKYNITKKCKQTNSNYTCAVNGPQIQNYTKTSNFGRFFIDILISLGVTTAVGLTASAILDFYYDLVIKTQEVDNFNHFLIRNEMNGGYIAVGTSKLSALNIYKRKLTIAYADLGPGLANLVNPISAATLEQIPTIFLTAMESSKITDNRVIQNINSEKIVENICKAHLVIEQDDIINGSIIKKIYDTLIKGFSYPRGAIVFIFKNDSSKTNAIKYHNKLSYYKNIFSIFESDYGFTLKKNMINHSADPFTGLYNSDWSHKKKLFISTNKDKLIKISDAYNLIKEKLNDSKHPIMLIGMGAQEYIYELLDFCRNACIPYILTLPMNGFGNIDDKYYAFRMGHTATYCGNNTIQHCDLLITWGTSLNKYVVVNLNNNFKHIKCIIDINKNPEIYYTPFINYYIIGDGQEILPKINKKGIIHSTTRPEWLEMINKFKKKGVELNSFFYSKKNDERIKHGDMYKCLQEHVDTHLQNTNKKVFFVTDSGSCQPFTASFIHYKTKNYFFLTDGKYGSIGNGLGEVMGAAINFPDDLFICICGDSATLDGAATDYITLMESNIKNIIFIILENSGIGFIAETSIEESNQILNYENGYKYFPDWKSLFKAFLIDVYIVKTANDMNNNLKCAFSNLYNRCSVLVCVLPNDAYYSPTIPIDGYFNQIIYHKFNENNKVNQCRDKKI